MKSKYFGLFLILIGFAIPFAIRRFFPTYLYASVPSAICFWAGFLIILSPVDNDEKLNSYFKWARYAIVLNIILTIFLLGYVYLVLFLDIRRGIGFQIMLFFSFLTNPIRYILDIFMAKPMLQQADGSVLVTTTFIRSLFTEFFNLLFYALSGMLLKILKDKKITLKD